MARKIRSTWTRRPPRPDTATRRHIGSRGLVGALWLLLAATPPALAGEPAPGPVPSTSASAPGAAPGSAATSTTAPPPAGTTAQHKADADSAFEDGELLFGKGDYLLAAVAFEEAYAHFPHEAALWNAARSWHRAGELDRAANRYAQFLVEAPAAAPDRDRATRALQAIAPKLGRFDVQAPGLTDVRVGGVPVHLPTVYVVPGAHVWTAVAGDRVVQRTERVEAGAAVSVVLTAETPAATASAAPAQAPSAPAAPQVVTVVVGGTAAPPASPRITPARASTILAGGVALVLLGLTIASGLDTLQARRDYDAAESDADKRRIFFDGVGKQQRTNALLGATLGGFALTGLGVAWIIASEPVGRWRTQPTGAGLVIHGGF